MSSVEEIEAAANALPPKQFRELLRRMEERAGEEWERQIEEDANAGRLDFLLEELSEDIAAGRTRPLDEICRKP